MLLFLTTSFCWTQSPEYQKKKAEKIEKSSVFTKIINRELKATIVYEDEDIIAFVPLRLQAPVHLLIVPKKENKTSSYPEKNRDNMYISSTYNELAFIITNQ